MVTPSAAADQVPRRGGTVATTECTEGTETMPPLCAVSTGVPISVEVHSSNCEGFVPTAHDVRRWLRAARRVPDFVAADATIDMAPCMASGTVTFTDGRSGTWSLRQNGYGTLRDDSGSTTILYAPGLTGRPFVHRDDGRRALRTATTVVMQGVR